MKYSIKRGKRINKFFTYFILIIATIITLTPLIWMISSSLSIETQTLGRTTVEEIEKSEGASLIIPRKIHFKNFVTVFEKTNVSNCSEHSNNCS